MFKKSLQSLFCILHPAYVLLSVCSLHFTLTDFQFLHQFHQLVHNPIQKSGPAGRRVVGYQYTQIVPPKI